jgi:hypothetical protein
MVTALSVFLKPQPGMRGPGLTERKLRQSRILFDR